MKYSKLLLAFTMAIAAAPITSNAQTLMEKPATVSSSSEVRTPEQLRFLESIVPKLRQSQTRRFELWNANDKQLTSALEGIMTDDGIDAFIEEAMGLRSNFQMLTDKGAFRKKLRSLFKTHVLQFYKLQAAVFANAQKFNAEMDSVDDDLLIAVDIDADCSRFRSHIQRVSADALKEHLDCITESMADSVFKSVTASYTSTGVGAAGGAIGTAIADKRFTLDGERSFLDTICAGAVGLFADYVITEVADAYLQPKQTLAKEIRDLREQFVTDVIRQGQACSLEMRQSLNSHDQAMVCLAAVFNKVDAKWALANR